jgi:hypothetical protein
VADEDSGRPGGTAVRVVAVGFGRPVAVG